jgi:hypothetical protein
MTLIVLDEAEMEFLEAVLMKSVVAAKAVLFPEAEEKTISAAGAYWRMLSSSPRIWALKSSSIWKASNTENHGVVDSLATPVATFPKISGLLSSA